MKNVIFQSNVFFRKKKCLRPLIDFNYKRSDICMHLFLRNLLLLGKHCNREVYKLKFACSLDLIFWQISKLLEGSMFFGDFIQYFLLQKSLLMKGIIVSPKNVDHRNYKKLPYEQGLMQLFNFIRIFFKTSTRRALSHFTMQVL